MVVVVARNVLSKDLERRIGHVQSVLADAHNTG